MNHPRRILLAVTGLSPQIVTETLYALTQKAEPPFVPTEIHLITTAQGADHARLNLLSDEPGWFHRLRRDYRLPEIAFDAGHIHVLRDARGAPLDDIRTPEENERTADFITEIVRAFTQDPAAALHVSIAGGRKTMGFYLGYALSLYGREQDRLSHVLVSPPFESHPQFYYPAPYERVIHTLDKAQLALDCRSAEVMLAAIPFVRLRHELPESLLTGKTTFTEAVAAAREALGPPELVLDLAARRIRAGGKIVVLAPADLALLAVFARRATRGEPPLPAPPKGAPDRTWADRYLAERRAIGGELADLDQAERALRHGMDGDYFSPLKSKLHKRLKKALAHTAVPYLIDDGGARPGRYRLALPPEAVRFNTIQGADILPKGMRQKS